LEQTYYEAAGKAAPRRSGKVFNAVLIAILVLVALLATYYYVSYNQLKQKELTTTETGDEGAMIRFRLKELAVIPGNETPTIATVTDAAKLKDNVFFRNAENGDKIAAFPLAKMAVLYRPSLDRIVWMGPLIDTTVIPSEP
jgi:hypothetical protein